MHDGRYVIVITVKRNNVGQAMLANPVLKRFFQRAVAENRQPDLSVVHLLESIEDIDEHADVFDGHKPGSGSYPYGIRRNTKGTTYGLRGFDRLLWYINRIIYLAYECAWISLMKLLFKKSGYSDDAIGKVR